MWYELVVKEHVGSLLKPATWRRAVLEDSAPVVSFDEQDEGAEHAAAFLRLTLRPWLEGKAQLRPDAPKRVLTLLRKVLSPRVLVPNLGDIRPRRRGLQP